MGVRRPVVGAVGRMRAGFAGLGSRGVVVGWWRSRGWCQPAGAGSALSLANAAARSVAQAQVAASRSLAWRPEKASRAAT